MEDMMQFSHTNYIIAGFVGDVKQFMLKKKKKEFAEKYEFLEEDVNKYVKKVLDSLNSDDKIFKVFTETDKRFITTLNRLKVITITNIVEIYKLKNENITKEFNGVKCFESEFDYVNYVRKGNNIYLEDNLSFCSYEKFVELLKEGDRDWEMMMWLNKKSNRQRYCEPAYIKTKNGKYLYINGACCLSEYRKYFKEV